MDCRKHYGSNKNRSFQRIRCCVAAFILPSNAFVLYALLTQQPMVKLLMAGIIPGLLTAEVWIVVIIVTVLTGGAPAIARQLGHMRAYMSRLPTEMSRAASHGTGISNILFGRQRIK